MSRVFKPQINGKFIKFKIKNNMKLERIVFMYTSIIEAISKITLKISIRKINFRSNKNNFRLRFS